MVWGDLNGVENLSRAVSKICQTIAEWAPNLFMLPSGKEEKNFIGELITSLRHFNEISFKIRL